MHHIDYGLSAFHRSAFECITRFPADLADVHRNLLLNNELAGFEVQQRFMKWILRQNQCDLRMDTIQKPRLSEGVI